MTPQHAADCVSGQAMGRCGASHGTAGKRGFDRLPIVWAPLLHRGIYAMTKRLWRPLVVEDIAWTSRICNDRRMYAIYDIFRLANRYAGVRQIAISTLARMASGSSTWFDRCATGRVTIRSSVAVVQWLSGHWPRDLDWPVDIPRPEPEPASPAAAFFVSSAPADALLGAVEAAKRRMDAAVQRTDWRSMRGAESEMYAAAMRLGPSGRIASPAALCRALGVRRHIYDDVVRRYRDETGAGRWPRAGNGCDRVLTALTVAGDVRFASRRARARAAA